MNYYNLYFTGERKGRYTKGRTLVTHSSKGEKAHRGYTQEQGNRRLQQRGAAHLCIISGVGLPRFGAPSGLANLDTIEGLLGIGAASDYLVSCLGAIGVGVY